MIHPMTCEDSLPPKSLAILMQSDFKMLTLQEQLHVVTAALHAQYRSYHVLFKREPPIGVRSPSSTISSTIAPMRWAIAHCTSVSASSSRISVLPLVKARIRRTIVSDHGAEGTRRPPGLAPRAGSRRPSRPSLPHLLSTVARLHAWR